MKLKLAIRKISNESVKAESTKTDTPTQHQMAGVETKTPRCACCGDDLSNVTPWTGRRWCYGMTNDGYRWGWFCPACRH